MSRSRVVLRDERSGRDVRHLERRYRGPAASDFTLTLYRSDIHVERFTW